MGLFNLGAEPDKYRITFEVDNGRDEAKEYSLNMTCETYADVRAAKRSIRDQLEKLEVLLADENGDDDAEDDEADEDEPPLPPQVSEHIAVHEAAVTEPPCEPVMPPRSPFARGLIKLTCPECRATFVVFHREPTPAAGCRCGHWIKCDESALDRFEFVCRRCGKRGYGHTNIRRVYPEQRSMTFECTCGEINTLSWSAEAGLFKNY